jgi:acyl-CoA synthetase (NDP forming)
VELAVIVTPAPTVPDLIHECVAPSVVSLNIALLKSAIV